MKDSIPKTIAIPHNARCPSSHRDCHEGVVLQRNLSTEGEEIIAPFIFARAGHDTQDSLLQTPRVTGDAILPDFVSKVRSGAGCDVLCENSSLDTLSSHDSTTSRTLWLEDDSEEGQADDFHDFQGSVHSVSESMNEERSVDDSHDFGKPVYSVGESMSCSSMTISVTMELRDNTPSCKCTDSIACTAALPGFQLL
mmetsp:Transcript_191/g.407  ORF Transcript_191/g.407 Transcript_191/m.407 type:complete len:196 (-) Transcript_191:48-635(-)|eukprot:scaffold5383_cov222-Amphora_coffeaeformis.AAC.20